jgi:hypothetical protein
VVGFRVVRLIPGLRPRRSPDWVQGLPPEKAQALSRNLRLILEPSSLLRKNASRPDPTNRGG